MKTLIFQPFKLSVIALPIILGLVNCPTAYAVSNIVLDGTTGTSTVIATSPLGTGTQYTLNGLTNGTLNGANLFFSFNQFNISAGDTALFQCATCFPTLSFPSVNVIARITGTTPTAIDGTLRSTVGVPGIVSTITPFTAANFWIFNPNGIILGAGRTIDLGQSIDAIGQPTPTQPTFNNGNGADRIIFSDGAVFGLTTPPNSSTLTVQNTTSTVPLPNLPVSFGFPPPPTIVVTPTTPTTVVEVIPTPSVPEPTPAPAPTPVEITPPPPPPPPPVQFVETHLEIDNNAVISTVVKPVVPLIAPPLPKKLKPCESDGESSLINKGIANYKPQHNAQVPYGITRKTNSVPQMPASNVDSSSECHEN